MKAQGWFDVVITLSRIENTHKKDLIGVYEMEHCTSGHVNYGHNLVIIWII